MRSYLILEEKAVHFNADAEIQALLAEIHAPDPTLAVLLGRYSRDKADALNVQALDRVALGKRGLAYERLDQLVFELLMGAR